MKRPKNILWISTDHMRFDCIAAHGNPGIQTPNLDYLVNNGVSFTNCFSQSPVCMPSRASFLTGLYPQQTGLTRNGQCLPSDFTPVASKCFKKAGYKAIQIGKLHFQPHEKFNLKKRNKYGFDTFINAEEPGCYEDEYRKWLRKNHPKYYDLLKLPDPVSKERSNRDSEGVVLDAPWQASFSGWVSSTASDYIKTAGKKFMHLGFYAPHPPLNPTIEMFEPYKKMNILKPDFVAPGSWKDIPAPLINTINSFSGWTKERFINYRRHFYAMVTGVDLGVGKIIQTLKENDELADTLIVFVSDHGDMCGDLNMVSKGDDMLFDQILHVPCVLFWPAGLGSKPKRINGLVEMADILPTLLGFAGGKKTEKMTGNSYAKALLAGKTPKGRDNITAFSSTDWAVVRTKKYKYINLKSIGKEILFELKDKYSETKNIAGRKPEILKRFRKISEERCYNFKIPNLPKKLNW